MFFFTRSDYGFRGIHRKIFEVIGFKLTHVLLRYGALAAVLTSQTDHGGDSFVVHLGGGGVGFCGGGFVCGFLGGGGIGIFGLAVKDWAPTPMQQTFPRPHNVKCSMAASTLFHTYSMIQ